MPRKSRSPGPSARTSAPRRSASFQRSAPASSSAVPMASSPSHHQPPAVPSSSSMGVQKQPGLFAQMASTAAGVAVGSAVGHTLGAGITSVFSGGSSGHHAADQQQQPPPPVNHTDAYGAPVFAPDTAASQRTNDAPKCYAFEKAYLSCLDANHSDSSACSYYLKALRECQGTLY